MPWATVDAQAAPRLGQRLMPERLDLLPSCLLFGLFVFGTWSGFPWLIGSAFLAVIVFATEQRRRRHRDGAVAHQRFAMSGRLGWASAGLVLGFAFVAFFGPILIELAFDPQDAPTWLRAVVAVILALGLWQAAQVWLRARARRIGSPDGGWAGPGPGATSGRSIAGQISLTQTVRVDALAEDLQMPSEELGPRLEALMGAGVVGRAPETSGRLRGGDWVHLTVRGEQALSERQAQSQDAGARWAENSEQR